MKSRTFYREFSLFAGAINPPANFLWNTGGAIALPSSDSTFREVPSQHGLAGGEDDAPFLEEIRLWCNFADGLTFLKDSAVDPKFPPAFYLWMGGNTAVPPANHFFFQPLTLNEWYTVRRPIPRYTPGISGTVSGLVNADSKFSTKSVSDAFAGEQVVFRLQLRITSALW